MLAGIMAMIMSTVDSYINATSVLIVHDFLKPLKINFIKSELISARIVSILIGILALNLALYEGTLLELIIITCSFYMPIVTVPFIMAIMGFRSTEKSVIIGMLAGFITVISWDYLWQIKIINSVFMGMISNLIFLIGSHYLLKQEGGWVGIKDTIPLTILRNQRKENVRQFLLSLKYSFKPSLTSGITFSSFSEGVSRGLPFFIIFCSTLLLSPDDVLDNFPKIEYNKSSSTSSIIYYILYYICIFKLIYWFRMYNVVFAIPSRQTSY
jgi:hypothetical protein